jgi:hypothetical protein
VIDSVQRPDFRDTSSSQLAEVCYNIHFGKNFYAQHGDPPDLTLFDTNWKKAAVLLSAPVQKSPKCRLKNPHR